MKSAIVGFLAVLVLLHLLTRKRTYEEKLYTQGIHPRCSDSLICYGSSRYWCTDRADLFHKYCVEKR